ncbi:hypothetical protein BGW38_000272 [Lunasporangiospora selenospora]|uniref:Peptidase A1 domain-containing protein n=1 Tax=Lunasporangiospora selenospora TaxID=979761 RepID=A0A9P6FVK5_9FUNG|nr:hypothetical protein BGW38_000272 [Lunasporangiospora selenospora]
MAKRAPMLRVQLPNDSLTIWLATISTLNNSLPIQSRVYPENRTPEALSRRLLQKRAAASSNVPLTSVLADVTYTMTMNIGTPPQPFNLLIDTGSSFSWVPSSTCLSPMCQSSKRFTCTNSATCLPLGTSSFRGGYLDGLEVSGVFLQEHLGIGSLEFTGVIGAVTQASTINVATVDGILGLTYTHGGLNKTNPDTIAIEVLNLLKNTSALTENKIGVWLQRTELAPNTITTPGGEITFGGVNPQRFEGEVTYINSIPGDHSWTIPVAGMTVGGKSVNINSVTATIDTGTTVIAIPRKDAELINGLIPGAQALSGETGIWQVPCTGNTSVTLTFGNFTVTIPYEELAHNIQKPNQPPRTFCISSFTTIAGQESILDQWILGDAFLKNVYSVFDFGTNAESGGRVGFAKLSPNANNGNGVNPGTNPGTNPNNGGNNGTNNGNNNGSNNGNNNGTKPSASVLRAAIQGSTLLAHVSLVILCGMAHLML